MRKQIITLALVTAAVGLSGCAASQSTGYKKSGISRETAQIDQLECTRSALIAKRRVLSKGGNVQEANASFWVEYHGCARRNGYKRRS